MLPEITDVEGIPVISVRRTILDLGGINHARTEAALDSALTKELMQIGQLCLLLEQEWMRGRRGVRVVRNLVIPRVGGLAPTDSDLELLMQRIIDAYGLPPAMRQHPIDLPEYSIHVDFAYPDARLAIEVDGYAWHLNRKAFEGDRERDNELRALGWTVLRFTWAMLKYKPKRVADLIRQSLESVQAAGVSRPLPESVTARP